MVIWKGFFQFNYIDLHFGYYFISYMLKFVLNKE